MTQRSRSAEAQSPRTHAGVADACGCAIRAQINLELLVVLRSDLAESH